MDLSQSSASTLISSSAFATRLVKVDDDANNPSGNVKLDDDETQYIIAYDVTVHDEKSNAISFLQDIKIILSGHSIYFQLNSKSSSSSSVKVTWMKLGLNQVIRHEMHASIIRIYPRIDLYLTSIGFRASHGQPDCAFYFKDKQLVKEFSTMLDKALQKRAWERREIEIKKNLIAAKKEEVFSTLNAGIGGIIKKQEAQRNQASELTTEAFQDLQALMNKAQDLMKVVDRYSSIIENKKKTETNQTGDDKVEDEFNTLLHSFGMVNPVTKKTAGSHFHEELARELSDFLQIHLTKHGASGIITLTDLYAIFNRARGMNLISPNDLVQACSLFERLKLPFKLKKFESGVVAVQSNMFSAEGIAKRIDNLLKKAESENKVSISAIDVAKDLSLSIQLALEHLMTAEKQLIICRDETVDGIRFFRNKFLYP